LAGRSDAATETWLAREIGALPCASRIHVHRNPSEAEKYSLLAGARFFCSPSRFEGWCIAAIEASSQGLPVVATRTDGFLDSAPDGHTSILVSNESDAACIAELSAAFRRLLTEPALCERLGTNGRAWAAHFDWPSTARMQGEFYRLVLDCLEGRPLPPPGIVNAMEDFLPA
jgi:glycosyltransferase involved in cell wall biosynthesis